MGHVSEQSMRARKPGVRSQASAAGEQARERTPLFRTLNINSSLAPRGHAYIPTLAHALFPSMNERQAPSLGHLDFTGHAYNIRPSLHFFPVNE